MCVVSMIGDHYNDKWNPLNNPLNNPPNDPFGGWKYNPNAGVSKEEFLQLKKEVLEMKELLKKAVEYDRKNNEPNCEMEDKIALLKKVAELVGVDLSEIFKPK